MEGCYIWKGSLWSVKNFWLVDLNGLDLPESDSQDCFARIALELMTYLQLFLCLDLFQQDGFQHVIDLLWGRVLAVASPYASHKHELLHAFAFGCFNEIDISLQVCRFQRSAR